MPPTSITPPPLLPQPAHAEAVAGKATPSSSGLSVPSGKMIAIIAGAACLLALLIAAAGGAVYLSNEYYKKRAQAVASQQRSEEKAADGLVDDLRKVMDESRDLEGGAQAPSVRMKTGGPVTNDVERIREVLGTYMNEMMSLQNEYLKALDASGSNSILDPVRFQRDTTFEETQKLLADCRMLVVLHRQKGLTAMDSFPARVEAMGFNETVKKQLLLNFEKGAAQSRPLFTQIWDIELATTDEIAALCKHLHATRNAWTSENGKFLFSNDTDIKTFNEHLQKIEANTQEQARLRQSSLDNASKKLDSYRK